MSGGRNAETQKRRNAEMQKERSREDAKPPAKSETGGPHLALSVRQPWAWLIANRYKDIENRTWPTRLRGRIYVHAGKGMTDDEYLEAFVIARQNGVTLPPAWELERGGIVGEVEIVGCVTESDSGWFSGPYGFVLRAAAPLRFAPCRGALGFFRPENSKISGAQRPLDRRFGGDGGCFDGGRVIGLWGGWRLGGGRWAGCGGRVERAGLCGRWGRCGAGGRPGVARCRALTRKHPAMHQS